MSAAVIPFPMVRRQAFIERHARYGASLKPEKFERYLSRQLDHQLESMLKRGVRIDLAVPELEAMERGIRNALWSAVLFPADEAE